MDRPFLIPRHAGCDHPVIAGSVRQWRHLVIALVTAGLFILPGVAFAGAEEGIAAFKAGRYEQAFEELKSAARNGNDVAQLRLAEMYLKGLGLEKNLKKANEWLERGAVNGNARAQLSLGYSYSHGIGVAEDKKKAASLYKKAAGQGSPLAQRNLGLMYKEGEGVERDYQQAATWFRRAAEQGDAEAQESLGKLYWKGKGVTKDLGRAADWYHAAALNGGTQKKLRYGIFLGLDDVNRDDEAYQWLRPAAINGVPFAQYRLGIAIANGAGVKKDWALGYAWIAIAKRSGNPRVQYDLDEMRTTLSEQERHRVRSMIKVIEEDPAAMAPQPGQALERDRGSTDERTAEDQGAN